MLKDEISIACINLNGVRSALNKGFQGWVDTYQPDVICVQETKAQIEKLPQEAYALKDYTFHSISAQKAGYSGVGIYLKETPKNITTSCGLQWADDEGRFISCELKDLNIISLYLPSGTSGPHRQALKYEMLDHIYTHILSAKLDTPTIICGDFNIAHTPMDIKRAKQNEKSSGFLPEERAWLSKVFELGYIDTYRSLHPEAEQYTWWTFRAGARQKNIGWRIDYQLATPYFKERLLEASVYAEPMISDHAILLNRYLI